MLIFCYMKADQTLLCYYKRVFSPPLNETKAIISYNVKSPMRRYPDYNL